MTTEEKATNVPLKDAAWLAARETKEGKCSRCDVPLILLANRWDELVQWDKKSMLPMRFACPKCEVFEVFCHDDEANLWSYQARDPEHSDWAWVPAWMRRAFIDAEFGLVTFGKSDPAFADTDGVRWITDMTNIVSTRAPRAEGAVGPQASFGPVVARLVAEAKNPFVYGCAYADASARTIGEDATFPSAIIGMVNALYPGCTWRTGKELDPAAAFLGKEVVALVMPCKPVAAAPKCRAHHAYVSDSVMRNFRCSLSIYHEGTVHRDGPVWDEREYPRTEETGVIDKRSDKSTPLDLSQWGLAPASTSG